MFLSVWARMVEGFGETACIEATNEEGKEKTNKNH